MKSYIHANGNITTTTAELDPADFAAVVELTPMQADMVAAGATVEYKDGAVIITPVPRVIETTTRVITKREFLKRITADEYATLKAASAANAQVDYFWQMYMLSEEIDLNHPDTIGGINALEAIGIFAAGRAAEILS
jgi:uncharacterized protein (DUF697 family)